ncbi:hypothetical protein CLV28_2347 [Sediminihabitans luteus]|uniref:Glycosyltransferase involved in cell wall biosynthesis n=1 Tax=Sediminihabitans luteus TaxID=1138585 RepID=A0A2M9CD70_9CELL|nr:glycosyl transferase [Sediminihabitans luteus]PJJ69871.1 hypothetical protein CLV28_2347 [Sediminihabitans luteus]GII99190.1 GDP-mannose:glycolipid 4-beta-D-mannosyltransferase [Sediminihabitans luteus]
MKPIRVVQSFRAPRPTTNPYITQLDRELGRTPGIDYHRFSWGRALLGAYDVFHWHWPEGKLQGSTWWKTAGKHVLVAMLWARHRVTRVAVVRTVHNVELPDVAPLTRRVLVAIDRSTSYRITLNRTTELGPDQPHTLILHGHYRDWFAPVPREARVPGRLGYFGGIRRYKSVATLIAAYRAAVENGAEISLRIGGRPSTAELADDLRRETADLPDVSMHLSFLSDEELVALATSSELVVLAYRFMHNSGSVLAALSLGRPVLVPRNPPNEALAAEVGPVWVQMFEGQLDAGQLLAALDAVRTLGADDEPDLSLRTWESAGPSHAEAYRRAVEIRRPGRRAASASS